MRICYLTQTATDISDEYKAFFKGKDLFFLTFKQKNENAISFLPKSSWSHGRNVLWEAVKDKYDYYVFIDDDLKFLKLKSIISIHPFLTYLYCQYCKMRHISLSSCYTESSSTDFFSNLESYLELFTPEVFTVAQVGVDPVFRLDVAALKKMSFIRRIGFFDAQFSVFSNYAANKLLPYDTKISGWWSSQIPIYLYSYHVFGSKAIGTSKLGVSNMFHTGAYVPNYDGLQDCKIMLDEITASTKKDYKNLAGSEVVSEPVSLSYGEGVIMSKIPKPTDRENYVKNYQENLHGLEEFLGNHILP